MPKKGITSFWQSIVISKEEMNSITKVVLFGELNIDFFYDVKTSMYYIFSQKFNSLNAAKIFMQLNKQLPFMSEVSIIKVEN